MTTARGNALNAQDHADDARDLDVVIVTFNSAPHLAACIASLPPGAHAIVVDNASDDDSVKIAERLGCEVLRNSENEGFGRAVNRAVRERVRGRHLLLLNPDAVLDAGCVSRLRAALAEEQVAVAGPRLRGSDGKEQRPWWDFPSARGAWREAFGLHRRRGRDFQRDADVPFVVGACLLVRTDAFRSVGAFDERFWLYGEEADLCRRLRDAGWRTHYVAGATANHIGGASGIREPERVAEHFLRGTERFVLTHDGPAALVGLRLAHIVGAALRLPLLRRADPRRGERARILRATLRSLRTPTRLLSSEFPGAPSSVVVCSLERWDATWRRNQFLVRELLAGDPSMRVLFVEPAVDVVHELRTLRRLPPLPRGRLSGVPGSPHVLRFRPLKLLPRRLGPWADRSLARQVIRAAGRAEMTEPILWINDLTFSDVATHCSWPALYDITDDWLDAAGSPREHAELARREAWLLEHADEVVVCSDELARRKSTARSVRTIPNAVDAAHFTTPRARPDDLPSAPVAVYLGTLHDERVDVPLLVRTAEQLSDVQFVLVGPSSLGQHSTDLLSRIDNVHLLGPRPYEDVPAYLQHADVIIVPHLVTAFTESLDPIKAYECAVVGRPTVATPVAGFRELGGAIRSVEPQQFSAAVRAALESPAPASHVDVPSWTQRAAEFRVALEAARLRTRHSPTRGPADRPIRVLRIWHSGVSQAWRERERHLRQAGVEVHLLAAHSWNEGGVDVAFEPDDEGLASPVRVLGSHPFLFAYDPRPIYRWLRHGRASFVDVEEEPASLAVFEFLVLRALARSRVPFALYSAENIEKQYPPPFRWIERAALARASAVRVCNVDADRIMRNKGFRGRVELIGLGADTERLGQAPRAAHDGFRVGYVGRLEEHKGIHVLIDAIALVPDVTLEIVGEGQQRSKLEERVRMGGLEGRVSFTGHVPHAALPRLYGTMDVVAIPSLPSANRREQFGRVAVEAMAAGVPVVASDCGELSAVIGDAGLLVPPGDRHALADAIRKLALDSELRQTLSVSGKQQAARYSWPEIAAAHQRLYMDLVDRRPGS